MTSFGDYSRTISDAELRSRLGKHEQHTKCDLITFLAVAQKMEIEILPIIWQAARALVGQGRAGKVTQSSINLQTSLAFKCLSDSQKRDLEEGSLSETDVFQTLVNEITVLGHEKLREHPNIVRLQGICWDIPEDDEVWPVLVFEKTEFEDLYKFLRLPVGREISILDRLKLCIDIGTALIDMHSLGIVHGDIKPDNVLVFKEHPTASAYTAKVIDFGYSSKFANEDDQIQMPRSEPWAAPEHRDKCKPAQGRKMDLFSFGMLCLWVLFEKYLSVVSPLPAEANWAQEYQSKTYEERCDVRFLFRLKHGNGLALFAEQLVLYEPGIPDQARNALRGFFKASLQRVSGDRAAEIKLCFEFFYNQTVLRNLDLSEETAMRNLRFEISQSKIPLYQGDYRVRAKIRHLLEQRVQVNRLHPTDSHRVDLEDNLAFQLAISYHLGFGGKRDSELCQRLLHQSRKTMKELEAAVRQVHQWPRTKDEYNGTKYSQLHLDGHVEYRSHVKEYRKRGGLKKAEEKLRQEIGDIESSFPETSEAKGVLLFSLALILEGQGRWDEAKDLFAQVLETLKKVLRQDHPSLLTHMTCLAIVSRKQGRWNEAKELQIRVMEANERIHGPEHPATLASMADLAVTYRSQGGWKEAEELEVKVMKAYSRVFGLEHPFTLRSMANLALTYHEQGQWDKTEELEIQVMNTCKRILEPHNPTTLTSMANLATTFWGKGRWDEAENLFLQVIEIRKEEFGAEHPDTLSSMSNLAATYCEQAELEKAEKLGMEVIEIQKRVLGTAHPSTLASMANLATTYMEQGQWDKAEELQVEDLRIWRRVFGLEHPSTLTSMANLASTYANQGRLDEAERSGMEVVEIQKRVLGTEHPDTLTSIANLADIYKSQGRLNEAEVLEVQVLDIQKKILGPEHPSTLISISNLASTYSDQGREDMAEGLRTEVLETQKRVLGLTHRDTLNSLAKLASIYRNQGRVIEAEELEVQSLETRKRLFGTEHPSTLVSMGNLALTFGSQSRWNEAEELQKQVMEISKRVFGTEHPATLISMHNLACTWKEIGRQEQAIELMDECVQLYKRTLGVNHPDFLSSFSMLTAWQTEVRG